MNASSPEPVSSRVCAASAGQEFDMRGSSSTYTYDPNSPTSSTVNPPDQGREGTRGDVSHGDEENR